MRKLVVRPALGLVALVACGGTQVDEGGGDGVRAKARGAVVAKVNGAPIGADEVQALVDASNLSPREALERLIQERLLTQYAESRGYGQFQHVRRETERARVRALLEAAVEGAVSPESITSEQISERFQNLHDRLPRDAKREDWEGRIREQLVLEAREKRLESLVKELRAREEVRYDEKSIQETFSEETGAGTGT